MEHRCRHEHGVPSPLPDTPLLARLLLLSLPPSMVLLRGSPQPNPPVLPSGPYSAMRLRSTEIFLGGTPLLSQTWGILPSSRHLAWMLLFHAQNILLHASLPSHLPSRSFSLPVYLLLSLPPSTGLLRGSPQPNPHVLPSGTCSMEQTRSKEMFQGGTPLLSTTWGTLPSSRHPACLASAFLL